MMALGGSDENYEPITFASEMTLRDYFAGKALPVIMKDWYDEGFECFDDNNEEWLASCAYKMADSMMKARENND
ncbi:MAG: hypothetical protein EBR39_05815 [Betaproteobacteria bacterium]|nr:hypothetical protein [Betaproteobacteria bacterium]